MVRAEGWLLNIMLAGEGMKICIIAEGSYPYVTGGVSSWLQMLMSWMSEHQFIICTIGAREKDRGKFNYRMPDNVVGIKEIFLDEGLKGKNGWGIRLKIKKDEQEVFVKHIIGESSDWKVFLLLLRKYCKPSVQAFFMSKDFYDIVEAAYRRKYAYTPFVQFYWTIRSMLIPLVYSVNQELPEADLYHSVSGGYAGVLGSLGKTLYHKPFIMTEHGIYTREREEEIIKSDFIKGCFKDIWIQHFHALSRCAYDHADKVVTLFNKNREIQIELGCDPSKIEIIPNGIQLDAYCNLVQKDTEDEYINIGAVVRIVPIKDIKTMIQGFAVAKKAYEKTRFYIMGPFNEDIEYFKECEQLVENLELNDVIFTGKVNVVEYMGKMDILVLSSISEGQPLAILEGMASNRPFVTTDVGSCRELIYGKGDGYGEAGVVVPVMDPEKMGKTIVQLCIDKELRVKMGKNALKRVSQLYTKERLVTAYKSLYNSYNTHGEQKYGGYRI